MQLAKACLTAQVRAPVVLGCLLKCVRVRLENKIVSFG